MILIGAHDAVTGESGYSWRKIFTLFARTQSKTIKEMLTIGVTYFDLRIRKKKRGWIFAHGFWESKCNCEEILSLINEHSPHNINISITYEGKGNSDFLDYVEEIKKKYPNINICSISIKYGKNNKWETISGYGWLNNPKKYEKHFMPLDFSSWHTLIPIPIFWKQFYYKHPEYTEDYYIAVDFI